MIELFILALNGLSATFGGNMGWAVLFFSLALRLALLPVSLRAARRRAVLERLAPELKALQARHADQPRELMLATRSLYAEHGVKLFDWTSAFMLVQAPYFMALQKLGSQSFLWIPDLTRPDLVLTLVAAALVALTPPDLRKTLLPAVLTLVFLWRMSAATALYSLASGLVGLLQLRLERRAVALGHW